MPASESTDIVKCTMPDGSVVYTNTGCDGQVEAIPLKPLMTIDHAPRDTGFAVPDLDISFPLVLMVYGVMSLLCFGVYWWDKRSSIKGGRRVREAHLHWLELLGGWPGAFIAQRKLRHKNRKGSYQFVF